MRQPSGWWLACLIVTPAAAQTLPPAAEPAGPGLRWVMPPVLLGGALAFDLRQERTQSEPARQQRLVSATLRAASFLYAPWLATVNGSVSLATGRVEAPGSEDLGNPEPQARHDRFVTGELRLGLFPRSRFPAELRYEVNDTRVDASLPGGVDYRSRHFAVSQRYRPADGSFAVSGSYERRTQDGSELGTDSQEALLADFSSAWKRHRLSAMLSRNVNKRGSTGEHTEFLTTQLRHSYADGGALSIESTGNWARSSEHLADSDRTLSLAQGSSVALWRSPTQPLQVMGSLRASLLQGFGPASTDSLTVGLGASYELSPRARVSGNLGATRLGGRTELASVGTLSGSFQGESRQFGAFNWDWFGGAALSAARNDVVKEATVSTQLGHTMSRVWVSSGQSSLVASLSQSVSLSQSSGAPATTTGVDSRHSRSMTHTGSLGWTSQGLQGSAFARLSVADARQFTGDQARLQLLNLQVSGTHELDRQRSWSGDLTLQRLLQRSMPVATADEPALDPALRVLTQGASGELTWRHNRVFDVPRLRFTSRLRVSYDTLRQAQALRSVADRETASAEQRLDYQVGRLDSSLSLLWSLADGKRRHSLLWRVQRSFGD